MDEAAAKIEEISDNIMSHIANQMIARGFSAAMVLYNNTQLVLRGSRHGRTYLIPNTRRHYTASEPGESPAIRTGVLRESWRPETHAEGVGDNLEVHSNAVSTYKVGGRVLGRLLENGSPGGKIKSRPYMQAVKDKSKKQINRIYSRPYF
jgi:hypothetical protein